jgi:hypothetical protein
VPIAAAKTQPAFMLLIVGPTVSIGVENFYSSIVEVTNVPVEDARGCCCVASLRGRTC